ncbi:hypothetical protein [Flavobacterium weaverense]|uniref:Lipoprotein n=1 Tax=Flavobacterium weaverense TaxID=271156 RepID=A0A3L9ZKC9_9FLAO|nr:hypothetical protein [Flavobacterium weaverense]RMA72557.1 hypothetical protein BC961_2960 [Flavobacterium weaverense]
MKKILLLFTIILIFTGCATQNIGNQKSKISTDNLNSIELVLINPKDNFIWKKGEFLSLKAVLTNKSLNPITILKPKGFSKINTDYFTVNFLEGRKLNFEGNPEKPQSRKSDDFITLLPNQTIELYINGDAYLTQFYSDETNNIGKIKLNLIYNSNEEKYNYTNNSYFILNNYKTKLTEEQEITLQKEIKGLATSPSVESKKIADQKIYLENYEKDYKANIINATPEELNLIIAKFNSLYIHKIESNSITIKIEK